MREDPATYNGFTIIDESHETLGIDISTLRHLSWKTLETK
jgi:hypothetical protein